MTLKNFLGETLNLEDIQFFFLFAPNNSGTTIISQYLATQLNAYLPRFGNNEGQGIPEVSKIMRKSPWKTESTFDWSFIRSAWEKRAGGRTFVEASPPNILRSTQIAKVFGHDSTALVSICNPYQYISSGLKRYHTPETKAASLAKQWVFKAQTIQHIRKSYPQFPFVSYESFVNDPALINRLLGLQKLPFTRNGKRGSGIKGIRSGFARSVGFITPSDIKQINRALAQEEELLAAFGYELTSPEDLILRAVSENAADFRTGVEVRAEWQYRAKIGNNASTAIKTP